MTGDHSGDQTDIISNDVLVAACRASDGVQAVLHGTLPPTAYPAFAHEVTHHWCFLSPIGAVVALLRACSDNALWHAKISDEVERAAPRRVRADALTEIMRPIAEGLALFAQLNMRMSNSGVIADPSSWATNYFVDAEDLASQISHFGIDNLRNHPDIIPEDVQNMFEERVNAFFDQARLAPDQLMTRERLSMRPLDARDGGYLSGYLLMRRCHNRIRRARVDPGDADSFLSFAREFFFHDTALATLALQDNVGVDQIASRMRHRLELFDSYEILTLYRQFITIDLATPRSAIITRWKPTIAAGIGVDAEGDEVVEARMTEILQEVGALPKNNEDVEPGAGMVLFRVASRDVFKLGSINGSVSAGMIGPIRSVMFEPDSSYGLPDSRFFFAQNSGPDLHNAVGAVDLLYWSTANRLAIGCYVDTQLIALAAKYEGLTPEAISLFKSIVDERRRMEHNVTLIGKQASVALNHVFQDFEGHVHRHIIQLINQLLTDRLFPGAASSEGVFDELRDRGLFKLYDYADRVPQYARLCALAASEAEVSKADIDDSLNWSSRCEVITGWPMIEIVRDRLLTAL